MRLLSWNVNGLRAVLKKDFTAWLASEKPDVLGLQEIKIADSLSDELDHENHFPGYLFISNGAKRPGYSGTGLLIRRELLSPTFDKHKDVSRGIGLGHFDDEGRIQILDLSQLKGGLKAYFINVYFPNSNHELSRLDYKIGFNEALLAHIKKLEKKQPVIIVGDFNVAHEEIDLARPKENVGSPGFTAEERSWFSSFLGAGFIDSFRYLHPKKIQYSWWSFRAGARRRNVGWRIDYLCCSEALAQKLKQSFILDQVMGSDHCPVGSELSN
jgi:exodeoxyribonuclease-3